jgi:hypothetical protein
MGTTTIDDAATSPGRVAYLERALAEATAACEEQRRAILELQRQLADASRHRVLDRSQAEGPEVRR